MLTRKIWLLISFMFAFAANAESPWPSVQSNMYPYVNGMLLTRHEQTILLGEGDQQTGIFYSALRNTFSEQVQNELINDALLKSWSLHSLVRLGIRLTTPSMRKTCVKLKSQLLFIFPIALLIILREIIYQCM